MLPWLDCGNPSSLYFEGRKARAAIDEAREAISSALGCLFAEVLFTSGGTEAANLAILGTALAHAGSSRRRVFLSAAEHHCVLATKVLLEALGYRVDLVPVDRYARVSLPALEEMLGDDVLLVSAMHANNELGTLNPVAEISELAHRHGALYHCDAVQTFARRLSWSDEPIPLLSRLPVDLLTVSAHKIGGPKAVGAIFIRAGVRVKPLIAGGGQEREVRGGTENVAGIVGFASAVQTSVNRPFSGGANPRDVFLSALTEAGFVSTAGNVSSASPPGPSTAGFCRENDGGRATRLPAADAHAVKPAGQSAVKPAHSQGGPPETENRKSKIENGSIQNRKSEIQHCLSGHAHVRLPGVDAETMLVRLDREGISASSGAACSSGSIEPSHVLLACGYSNAESKEGLRFTFGPSTTIEHAGEAARRVIQVAQQIQTSRK